MEAVEMLSRPPMFLVCPGNRFAANTFPNRFGGKRIGMALVFWIGGAGAQRNSPNTCVIIQALDHEGLATYPERTDYFVMRLL